MSTFHWCAPPPPSVASVEFPLAATPLVVRTEPSLRQSVAVAAHTLKLEVPAPRAISIGIAHAEVHVHHYAFAPPVQNPSSDVAPSTAAAPRLSIPPSLSQPLSAPPASVTRIKAPRDLVKLEDRLHYLLQPPLESLLAEGALSFPFRPFPFQFEGVAFLYPRQAAILADEMGLGKTMQAITALRLLLRRGEVQNVLLVCPKPLVTNWQREFAIWAPEVPVTVVEGDQQRRHWQWRLPDVPIRIANYELLLRDRELFEGQASAAGGASPLHFDLVVLDESQRIKNRESTTSEVVRSISRRRSWRSPARP